VRAALISIAGQPLEAGSGTALRLAGKTLAWRQMEFALAAGCEQIIALGDGSSAEAIGLRHAAEAAGARFQSIREPQGLLGLVRAADELLVLAPGLLAEAPRALELLENGNTVLTLPAAQGVAAGFERIDLERAWAGALVVPGGLVDRLSELPSDSEPASALLRVALQAQVPEVRLPVELLADGSWAIFGRDELSSGEKAWLKRHLQPVKPGNFSSWLARQALRPLAGRLLAQRQVSIALFASLILILGTGVGVARFGMGAVGFALVALGALVGQFGIALRQLGEAPFGAKSRFNPTFLACCATDTALVACGILAIHQDWPHRLFPPLVLLGVLHAAPPTTWANAAALAGDRAVLAVLFALAAGFGLAEPAIMAAGLGLLALKIAQSLARRG
jgi:hypothetical protein